MSNIPTVVELFAGQRTEKAIWIESNLQRNLFADDGNSALQWDDGHYIMQVKTENLIVEKSSVPPHRGLVNQFFLDNNAVKVIWNSSNRSVNINIESSIGHDVTSGRTFEVSFGETELYFNSALIYTQNDRFLDFFAFDDNSRNYAFSDSNQGSERSINVVVGIHELTISKHSSSGWLLEVDEEQTPDQFISLTNKAMQVLGWLGGYWPCRGLWLFCNAHNSIIYKQLRSADWKVGLTPVTSNVHGWFNASPAVCDFWKDRCIVISSQVLKRVIELTQCFEDYHRLVFFLMEFNQVSQEVRPVISSAALETFANLVDQFEIDGKTILPSKTAPSVRKKIRKSLNSTLKGFENDLSAYWLQILFQKIDGIFDFRPNRDRLEKSLEGVGLWLSDDDREAVVARNNYLHGRYSADDSAESLEKSVEHSIRVYDMISEALLRLAGFDGPVVNHFVNYENRERVDPNTAFRTPTEGWNPPEIINQI